MYGLLHFSVSLSLLLSLDHLVLLGNHYDAWTFGAVDPNSGTAVLLEISRVLGQLRSTGKGAVQCRSIGADISVQAGDQAGLLYCVVGMLKNMD